MFEFLCLEDADILRYLPRFLAADSVFKNTADAESAEHNKLRKCLMELARQMRVETATWGLDDWEDLIGESMRKETYPIRRNRVLLKLQGAQTSTKDFMQRLATRYLEYGTARIHEMNEENRFRVLLVDAYLLHKSALKEALETYKPAHLAYDFMHLCIENHLPILIRHHTNMTQHITARHIIWNLGSTSPTIWNGDYLFDGSICWDGIKPDAKYRERQGHQLRMSFLLAARQAGAIHHRSCLIGRRLAACCVKVRSRSKNKAMLTPSHRQGIAGRMAMRAVTSMQQNAALPICTPSYDGRIAWDGMHDYSGAVYALPSGGKHLCAFVRTNKNEEEIERSEIL